MTRYFYDCEFLEDGSTIELISIGIVADDGREFYAINRDFPWRRIASRKPWAPWQWTVHQPWLLDNVVSSLPKIHGDRRNQAGNGPLALIDWQSPAMMSRDRIATKVAAFVLANGGPRELWADYGAYDHVALCQLWGRMIDLPDGIPMWTNDLRQKIAAAGNPALPEQEAGQHNALADARHDAVIFSYLEARAAA